MIFELRNCQQTKTLNAPILLGNNFRFRRLRLVLTFSSVSKKWVFTTRFARGRQERGVAVRCTRVPHFLLLGAHRFSTVRARLARVEFQQSTCKTNCSGHFAFLWPIYIGNPSIKFFSWKS